MDSKWDGIIDLRPSAKEALVYPDGRIFQASDMTVSEEWIAQAIQGYRCMACWEPFIDIGSFPERCPLCQFEVRDRQMQLIEERFKGIDEQLVAPGVPLAREREEMKRATYRPKGYVTMSIPKKRKRK